MINFEDIVHRTNKALLVQSDINTILNCEEEFVTFHISVSNSGHCVQFTTDSEPMGLDDEWNGYDFALTLEDFEIELEKFGTIYEMGGKWEFMWNNEVSEWDKECFNDGYGGY